jgi:hypothetical protein
MRKIVLALLVALAASVAACGNLTIGPVDHSCPVNPHQGGDDSGCT